MDRTEEFYNEFCHVEYEEGMGKGESRFTVHSSEVMKGMNEIQHFMRTQWEGEKKGKRYDEYERDLIDEQIVEFITSCRTDVTALQAESSKLGGRQYHEIVSILSERLKSLSTMYQSMQHDRYKKVLEDHEKYRSLILIDEKDVEFSTKNFIQLSSSGRDNLSPSPDGASSQDVLAEFSSDMNEHEINTLKQELHLEFEQLNNDLLDELDDVSQIEVKMKEVTELVNTFTSKLLEQQGEVESIYDASVNASAAIDKGEKELRKTVDRSKLFRSYYITFTLSAAVFLLIVDFLFI